MMHSRRQSRAPFSANVVWRHERYVVVPRRGGRAGPLWSAPDSSLTAYSRFTRYVWCRMCTSVISTSVAGSEWASFTHITLLRHFTESCRVSAALSRRGPFAIVKARHKCPSGGHHWNGNAPSPAVYYGVPCGGI